MYMIICVVHTSYFWKGMMQCECLEGVHSFKRERRVNAESQVRGVGGGWVTGGALRSQGKCRERRL